MKCWLTVVLICTFLLLKRVSACSLAWQILSWLLCLVFKTELLLLLVVRALYLLWVKVSWGIWFISTSSILWAVLSFFLCYHLQLECFTFSWCVTQLYFLLLIRRLGHILGLVHLMGMKIYYCGVCSTILGFSICLQLHLSFLGDGGSARDWPQDLVPASTHRWPAWLCNLFLYNYVFSHSQKVTKRTERILGTASRWVSAPFASSLPPPTPAFPSITWRWVVNRMLLLCSRESECARCVTMVTHVINLRKLGTPPTDPQPLLTLSIVCPTECL